MSRAWQPPLDRPLEHDAVGLDVFVDRRVAIVGYGTMGRAQALNLRDSGVAVVVGARQGSQRGDLARREGFEVGSVGDVVADADVIMLMLPDEVMAEAFTDGIEPRLQPDAALGFAHGFAVAFHQIDPGERACFLVAPKSQGDLLRERYLAGGGAPGLLAVTDRSPDGTWLLAAAYARAVGCLRGGGWRTTFRDECVADQFGEQAVLCGGVVELLQAAFDTLVTAGHDPTNAFFECVHELKLITDLLHRYGVAGMRARISPTAAYGGLTRGPRVIDGGVRRRMAEILTEIETGGFAREFLARHDDPEMGTRALIGRESKSSLAGIGRVLQHRLDAANGPPDPTPDKEASE